MAQAEIGLIGLGVMGANLALNIAEKGFPVAVYNRTAETTVRFHAEAGTLQSRITPCPSLEDLVKAIRPPRPIIIMVKAGEAVDEQIVQLRALMSEGDIIIDAGNATRDDFDRVWAELRDDIAAAIEFAEASPLPAPEQLLADVYTLMAEATS